jgi:Spy/CpxP family protein refolding chaperone
MVFVNGKSLLVGVLVVPLLLTLALTAEAGARRPALARLQSELSLTPEQVQAIRQIQEGQREARRELRHSLRDARRALRELVLTGADDQAVQTGIAEVQQLTARAVQARTDTLRAVAQVLTPEQRDKLRTLRPGRL